MTLAEAIAKLENTNPSYNNPGAISGTGDTGTSFGAGIGIYSSLGAGQAALDNQISAIYNGASKYYDPSMSLSQFDSIYSGGARDGTQLASMLGTTPDASLASINNKPSSSSWMPDWLSSRLSTRIGGTATPLHNDGTPSTGTLWSRLGISAENVVVGILGLILIAAGLFAFKSTQTIIETGGKLAKKGAELASA